MSLSSVGFLRRGVTIACLNLSGKTPSRREMLLMMVIGVMRTSRYSLMMKVGQGSKPHYLAGDLNMSFLTSSLVNGWKQVEVGCSLV